jgi:hypothetical protein
MAMGGASPVLGPGRSELVATSEEANREKKMEGF